MVSLGDWMLEETHKRIAGEIAKKLELGKAETELLKIGSTRPDGFEAFPHHRGKNMLKLEKVLDARSLFLSGDDEAYVRLGEAIHYVADTWTVRPRTSEKHTHWEGEIEREIIEPDSYFIKSIESATIPTKVKEFYLTLLEVLNGISMKQDFSKISRCFEEWVFGYEFCEELEEWFARKILLMPYEEKNYGEMNVKIDSSISNMLGGAFLVTILNDELSNLRENYSTPKIDLNFAFRIGLIVSYIVLSPDVSLPSRYKSLNWKVFPPNWKTELRSCMIKEKSHIEKKEEEERLKALEKLKKEKEEEMEKKKEEEMKKKEITQEKKDSCFIATAAYGSKLAGQITILRKFRDAYLTTSKSGQKLVNLYYTVSPPVANFISRRNLLRVLVRLPLDLIIHVIQRWVGEKQ